jgi:uncharacterized membrane protein YagU involved in acid resistance
MVGDHLVEAGEQILVCVELVGYVSVPYDAMNEILGHIVVWATSMELIVAPLTDLIREVSP